MKINSFSMRISFLNSKEKLWIDCEKHIFDQRECQLHKHEYIVCRVYQESCVKNGSYTNYMQFKSRKNQRSFWFAAVWRSKRNIHSARNIDHWIWKTYSNLKNQLFTLTINSRTILRAFKTTVIHQTKIRLAFKSTERDVKTKIKTKNWVLRNFACLN